ncbi:MAG: hypothetical protein HQL03_07525 [Nitrospirae bacterium]|nr:hypothetical protein [Nitrospirota bacterium]MBF0592386.1 hypothetical protein [Nitrospirota bacterium]
MSNNSMVRHIALTGLIALSLAAYSCNDTREGLSNMTVKKVEKIEQSRIAVEKSDIDALKRGITTFNATNGRYPKDLDELAEFTALTFDKGIYNYNPQTGAIALR